MTFALLRWPAALFALIGVLDVMAPEPRVVAVGDIHGSLEGFVTILSRAGLIDANRRWSGGTATLVQTGDFMDRGAGVRAVMDLLMSLESQAGGAGGRLIVLLGNHEVMNLLGETRDVTPEIFATFADGQSESRRERAWRQYEQLARTRTSRNAPASAVYRLSRDAWMAAHPKGYLEYREALGPRGVYGRWLRDKAPLARVGGTAFMHAGVDLATAELGLDGVNATVKRELGRFDACVDALVDRNLALPFFSLQEVVAVTVSEVAIAARQPAVERASREAPPLDAGWLADAASVNEIEKWAILAPDGPMWFRGFATAPDTDGPKITTILQRLGAERIVAAHTPQPQGTITARFDNRLFLIDTGMLASVFRGRPSALDIDGGRIRALYPGEEALFVEK